jgi:putative FmdB family regulatory protein
MPFYEYECSNCRFYVEVLQKISEEPLQKCPSCGKKTLKKLVSAPVFRLKGSGWYETDFKSDQEGKRNLAAADKEQGAGGGKDEAKPAAEADKSETKAEAKAEGQAPGKASGESKGAAERAETRASGSGRTAVSGGKKTKSKGAGPGKGAGLKRSTSSKPKPSSKRRRGR